MPNFDMLQLVHSTMVVWIRSSNLRIEYYHPNILRKVGDELGHTKRIDIHTQKITKAKFDVYS